MSALKLPLQLGQMINRNNEELSVKNMHKQKIIEAIHNQQMLKISFRRESDNDYVTRNVAPYDVYPTENKQSGLMEDILLGYAERDFEHEAHAVSIYLSNIQSVIALNQTFDGPEIRRLLKVKRSPYVSRNW